MASTPEWILSVVIHLFAIGGIFVLITSHVPSRKKPVEMVIVEAPTAPPQAITLSKPKPVATPTARKVFGVSRKAETTENGETAKLGNTLAKEPDKETLKPSDADSLPVPTEEYLVTQMPQLTQEVFVPYPPEAKKHGIQGVVTMDLLIDSEGNVRKVDLVDGPDPELNAAAVKAAPSFKFKPALVEKKPVSVKIRYAYKFVIQG